MRAAATWEASRTKASFPGPGRPSARRSELITSKTTDAVRTFLSREYVEAKLSESWRTPPVRGWPSRRRRSSTDQDAQHRSRGQGHDPCPLRPGRTDDRRGASCRPSRRPPRPSPTPTRPPPWRHWPCPPSPQPPRTVDQTPAGRGPPSPARPRTGPRTPARSAPPEKGGAQRTRPAAPERSAVEPRTTGFPREPRPARAQPGGPRCAGGKSTAPANHRSRSAMRQRTHVRNWRCDPTTPPSPPPRAAPAMRLQRFEGPWRG